MTGWAEEDEGKREEAEAPEKRQPRLKAAPAGTYAITEHMEGCAPPRPHMVCGHDRAWP